MRQQNALPAPDFGLVFPVSLQALERCRKDVSGKTLVNALMDAVRVREEACLVWDARGKGKALLRIEQSYLSKIGTFSPIVMRELLGFDEVTLGGNLVPLGQVYGDDMGPYRYFQSVRGLHPYLAWRVALASRQVNAERLTATLKGMLLASDADTRGPKSWRALGNSEWLAAHLMMALLRPVFHSPFEPITMRPTVGAWRYELVGDSRYKKRRVITYEPWPVERFPPEGFDGYIYLNEVLSAGCGLEVHGGWGGNPFGNSFRSRFIQPLLEISANDLRTLEFLSGGGSGFRPVTITTTIRAPKEPRNVAEGAAPKKASRVERKPSEGYNKAQNEHRTHRGRRKGRKRKKRGASDWHANKKSLRAWYRSLWKHDAKAFNLFYNVLVGLFEMSGPNGSPPLEFHERGRYRYMGRNRQPEHVPNGRPENTMSLEALVKRLAEDFVGSEEGKKHFGADFFSPKKWAEAGELPSCLVYGAVDQFSAARKARDAKRDKGYREGALKRRGFRQLRRGSLGFQVPLAMFEQLRKRWGIAESVVLERGRNGDQRYTLTADLTQLRHLSGTIKVILHMGGTECYVTLGLPFVKRMCPPGEAPPTDFTFSSLPAGETKLRLTNEYPSRWNDRDQERLDTGQNQVVWSGDENVSWQSLLLAAGIPIPSNGNDRVNPHLVELFAPHKRLAERVKQRLAVIDDLRSLRDRRVNARPVSAVSLQQGTLKEKAVKELKSVKEEMKNLRRGEEELPDYDLEVDEDEGDAEQYGASMEAVMSELEEERQLLEKKIRSYEGRKKQEEDRFRSKMRQSFGLDSQEKKERRSRAPDGRKPRKLRGHQRAKLARQEAMRKKYDTPAKRKKWYAKCMRKKIQLGSKRIRQAEAKVTRSVRAFHKAEDSLRARKFELVVWPKADHTWTQRKGRFRIVSRANARLWKRLSPCWAWEHFARNSIINYGCRLAIPHEGFTSNTCLWCGRFHKVRRVLRHRLCPNQDCPVHDVQVHGELPAVINMLIAAACQAAIRCNRGAQGNSSAFFFPTLL